MVRVGDFFCWFFLCTWLLIKLTTVLSVELKRKLMAPFDPFTTISPFILVTINAQRLPPLSSTLFFLSLRISVHRNPSWCLFCRQLTIQFTLSSYCFDRCLSHAFSYKWCASHSVHISWFWIHSSDLRIFWLVCSLPQISWAYFVNFTYSLFMPYYCFPFMYKYVFGNIFTSSSMVRLASPFQWLQRVTVGRKRIAILVSFFRSNWSSACVEMLFEFDGDFSSTSTSSRPPFRFWFYILDSFRRHFNYHFTLRSYLIIVINIIKKVA